VNSPDLVLDSAAIARLRHLAETVAQPGEDLIAQLVDIFVNDSRSRLEALTAAWRAGDAAVACRAAHTIKGSAANLGASRVVLLSRAIEQLCRDQAVCDEVALESLRVALDEAWAALRAL
jgi:HPt (histidine-containing phosphotransfer) domain-containing protein